MATAYSVFANGGYRVNPVLIARITDARGKLLHQVDLKAPDESQRVIDARNAFVMTSLMQESDPLRHGRARAGHPEAA